MPILNAITRFAKTAKTVRKMNKMMKTPKRENKAARARLKAAEKDVQKNPRPNELSGVAKERAARAKAKRINVGTSAAGVGVAGGTLYGVSKKKKK